MLKCSETFQSFEACVVWKTCDNCLELILLEVIYVAVLLCQSKLSREINEPAHYSCWICVILFHPLFLMSVYCKYPKLYFLYKISISGMVNCYFFARSNSWNDVILTLTSQNVILLSLCISDFYVYTTSWTTRKWMKNPIQKAELVLSIVVKIWYLRRSRNENML